MRAVFDTNVLVSAAVFGGIPLDCVLLAAQEKVTLVLSPQIVEEFARILAEKFANLDQEVFEREQLIRQIATLVEPKEKIEIVADPTDNRILEAAITGKVDVIVSGDQHLLQLRRFRGIRIVTPRQFLNLIR